MLRVCFILFPSPMEATQPGAVPGEEEAPQKRIKVEVEEETMPTKPEPSSAGDVELSGEVHTILINGFPSASGSCARQQGGTQGVPRHASKDYVLLRTMSTASGS